MTARLLPWIIAGCVLTLSGSQALCVSHPDVGEAPAADTSYSQAISSAPATPLETSAEVPEAETPLAVVVESTRQNWCEPIHPPYCENRHAECTPLADGTPRACRIQQWTRGKDRACLPTPGRELARWRRERLRAIAASVCKGARCRPKQLGAYLTVMVSRETSTYPGRRHRLNPDVRSAQRAWTELAPVYAGSPAARESDRWLEGLGYFGQNPSFYLRVWDESAEPETLCGEVESTLVHLRTARLRRSQLTRGVDCGGDELYHGSAEGDHGPSWYDISRANSGSNACPPKSERALTQRRKFVKHARERGLDPFGPVTRAMLGQPVSREDQDSFAEDLRETLDREHPRP